MTHPSIAQFALAQDMVGDVLEAETDARSDLFRVTARFALDALQAEHMRSVEFTGTGGGCMAIRVDLGDGADILITGGDADLPNASHDVLAMHYRDADDEGTVIYEGSPRDLTAMAKAVDAYVTPLVRSTTDDTVTITLTSAQHEYLSNLVDSDDDAETAESWGIDAVTWASARAAVFAARK